MASKLKQTEQILQVLQLKRQLIEKSLAELSGKLAAIKTEMQSLSIAPDVPSLDDDAQLSFAVASQKWAMWRQQRRRILQQEQTALAQKIVATQGMMRVLVVQIDTVEHTHSQERLRLTKEADAKQSRERLETWIAAG